MTDRRAAERQAQRLIEVLEESNEVVVLSDPSGRLVYSNPRAQEFLGLGASIGVAFDVGGVDKIGNLLRQADVALYRAKRAGGYRVELADPGGAVTPPSPRSAPADAG
ncbi:MAG TPA: hypothetical protein VFW06_08605 [Acidimicrobiia bacterium]|nr:hypothetical protein [Acidimicrobiia bacterium]